MRRYHSFTTSSTIDQALAPMVVTESEVCVSGVGMLADLVIGDLLSTGHSTQETWNHLHASGLSSSQILTAYEHRGIQI